MKEEFFPCYTTCHRLHLLANESQGEENVACDWRQFSSKWVFKQAPTTIRSTLGQSVFATILMCLLMLSLFRLHWFVGPEENENSSPDNV